jgi:hypothetical protein
VNLLFALVPEYPRKLQHANNNLRWAKHLKMLAVEMTDPIMDPVWFTHLSDQIDDLHILDFKSKGLGRQSEVLTAVLPVCFRKQSGLRKLVVSAVLNPSHFKWEYFLQGLRHFPNLRVLSVNFAASRVICGGD